MSHLISFDEALELVAQGKACVRVNRFGLAVYEYNPKSPTGKMCISMAEDTPENNAKATAAGSMPRLGNFV